MVSVTEQKELDERQKLEDKYSGLMNHIHRTHREAVLRVTNVRDQAVYTLSLAFVVELAELMGEEVPEHPWRR